MENKRYLKTFLNEDAYETKKYQMLGVPHVIWLTETDEVLYKGEASEDENISFEIIDGNLTINNNNINVINDNLIISGYNIFIDNEGNKYNIIFN